MANINSKVRLDGLVRERYQVSWGKARGWIETAKVWLDGRALTDPALPMDPHALIELKMNAPKPKTLAMTAGESLNPRDVVYEDTQVIVVNKRAGINTVVFTASSSANGKHESRKAKSAGAGIKEAVDPDSGSLEKQVCRYLDQARVRVVHRVDRETSGLVVFARTAEAEERLAQQFRFHSVRRRYFALAHGWVKGGTIRSQLVENRGDGLRGSISKDSPLNRDLTQEAVTYVETLEASAELSLIECRLETGRTHQIRIHLSEAGHPLLGEKAYIREYTQPLRPAPRLMLHAAELGFVHPTQDRPLRWTCLPPDDFMGMLAPALHARLEERLADPLERYRT